MVMIVWFKASSFPWENMWSLLASSSEPYIDMVFPSGKGKRFSIELVPLFDPDTNIVSCLGKVTGDSCVVVWSVNMPHFFLLYFSAFAKNIIVELVYEPQATELYSVLIHKKLQNRMG